MTSNKEQSKIQQPDINIGIVGHIDHGKTTLLQKLSGKWAAVHSEELKRGITIKLGYANVGIKKCKDCGALFTLGNKCPKCGSTNIETVREVSFVDAPGHEMLMASMLGGAAVIDAAILVVAANEPFPQPQTKEHFLALTAKGIKHLIIVQNKIDLVTEEQTLKNYNDIKKFLTGTQYENVTVIPVSALQSINLNFLLEEIIKLPKPERDLKAKPLFFVVRSFDINKPGTELRNLRGGVLGGTLRQGVLKINDEIEIKPGLSIKKEKKHQQTVSYKTLKCKIVGLMSGSTPLKESLPYGNLAIQTTLDPSLTKSDSLAGCVVGLTDSLPDITNNISIKVKLFEKVVGTKKEATVEKLKTNESLLLSVNTAVTVGFVRKIKPHNTKNKNEEVRQFDVELNLKYPIVPIEGIRIGIARNINGHWRLIGYGELST